MIDYRRVNFERIFRLEWKVGSIYECPDYPIHTYVIIACDLKSNRWLITAEAVDQEHSRGPGLNTEVDGLLIYTSS